MFKCECGKEFENAQSYNGHKSHCKAHYLAKYGSLEQYNKNEANCKKRVENAGKAYNAKRIQAAIDKAANWVKEKHTCEKCGKVMTQKYGSGRFCSEACSHSHIITDNQKQKLRETIAKNLAANGRHIDLTLPNNYNLGRVCKECGKLISNKNKSGLCAKCLQKSPEFLAKKSEAGKKGYETKLKNGTHYGWQSRNIISYPEKFWIDVLTNNNISYIKEYKVPHNDSVYFLDFLIEVNNKKIDLEIDGKQHKERKEHDAERDAYLESLGYTVYRIDWNSINSEDGKQLMKQKIDAFLEYYKNARIV